MNKQTTRSKRGKRLRVWSDTRFSSLPPKGFVSGPGLATVFTNGIPSEAKYLVVPL